MYAKGVRVRRFHVQQEELELNRLVSHIFYVSLVNK